MFRTRELARTWAITLMAAGLGAAPALAGPVEARCTELGSACLCSEPLRFTSGGWLYENVDPPDSEGPGAKECGGGATLDAEPTGMQLVNQVDNASNLDFPGASNPPAYVLKMTAGTNDPNNGWLMLGNLPTGVRNETICSRSYQRFGNDLALSLDPSRVKVSQAIIGPVLFQDGITIDGSGRFGIHNGDCDGTINLQQAGRQSWLRHEACLDVGTNSVAARTRVVVIDTGVTEDLTCGPWPLTTPANFTNFEIGNLFVQTDGRSNLTGSRYFTQAIQTRVPLNTSFWPGAATELEGGSGAPPPGSGAPPPPPAPVPLGKPGQPVYTP